MGLKENEFMLILQMLSEELMGDSSEGGFWDDVVANAKPITEAIERFLPFGAVTMLGADPGTGKTVFLYRIAEARFLRDQVYGPAELRARQRAAGAEG